VAGGAGPRVRGVRRLGGVVVMAAPRRHLRAVEDELEAGDRFNWGCLLAILASLLVWAIIAMLVLFLL